MFNQNGLSLDQAPPISVVFTFFLTGALFGIVSGISLFFYGVEVFDSTSVGAVTFTHLLTLGVMLSFMFAALFQMLPVIAGITLTSPQKKANLLLYPFILGLISLLLGFNFTQNSWLFLLASGFLAFAIFMTIIPMLNKLLTLAHHTPSSKGMSIALLTLAVVLLLALYLLSTLSGIIEGHYYTQIKTAHYSFGLFGWIALLIISISFQVIEMFYVTPPYPKNISHNLPLTLFVILGGTTLLGFFYSSIWIISHMVLSFILIFYALLTLKRLSQKKRPLSDATVWFWRVGLSFLILSMFLILLGELITVPFVKALSFIFFSAFALSIVFAMFYKIVPFLTWFHLNSQGYFTAPMMHEVIHPKTAMKHLYIHGSTIVTFVLSLFINSFIYLAGLLMLLSFSWMAYQIIHAHKLYKETQKNGEKFDMGNIA